MTDASVLFVCSRCDARFVVYGECVQHTSKCPSSSQAKFVFQSIDDFSTRLPPVSKARRNFEYHQYIREKILSFLPDGADIAEAARRSETKGAWRLLNLTKTPARRVEFRDSSAKPTFREVTCLELGPLTVKNVATLLRTKTNKEFAANSMTLLYNGHSKTFPKHITHLWSKTDLHFWPFFFSKEDIFSEIFSAVRVRGTECLIVADGATEWTPVAPDFVLKSIAERVIVPLMQCLCLFVVDCVNNKKCHLNSKWTDMEQESRSIENQLSTVFGGGWFDFFKTLPAAFDHLAPLPPFRTFIDCGLDSILKGEITPFSRDWIPFLAIFCRRDDIVSKYGGQYLQSGF